MISYLTHVSVGLHGAGDLVVTVTYTGGKRAEATTSFKRSFKSLGDVGRYLPTIELSMGERDDATT